MINNVCYKCDKRQKNRLTVDDCAQCFIPDLYPIHPRGCMLCTRPINIEYFELMGFQEPYCSSCWKFFKHGNFEIDDVIPISYNIPNADRLTSYLVDFKDYGYSDRLTGLGAVLYKFLKHNYYKICDFHGGIDYITYVPGWNRHHNRQIIDFVCNSVEHSRFEYEDLLVQKNPRRQLKNYDNPDNMRVLDYDLFEAKQSVKGKNILLFDDMFIRGSTICSAAYTLYESGAQKVIGLVLTRCIEEDDEIDQLNQLKTEKKFNFREFKHDYSWYNT